MSNANENMQADLNIIEMHKKARRRKKVKTAVILTVIVVVVLVGVAIGVTALRKKISSQVSSSSESSVTSAEVTTGSISTTVSGSGTLADQDVESITVSSSLEIADYYVEEGDEVAEGDLIATVTSASLMSAMNQAQSALDTLDAQIEDAAADEVDDTIATSVSGRVKKIYVEEGDDVATAMYEYGALALLSLDGYMAVDVESDSLSAGDTVTVTTSDDTEYTGTVDKCVSGTATILISDKGPEYEDAVTVADEDGSEIGTGTLYIHSQMAITGYAGTIDDIDVSENEAVDADDTLFELTDTETSANYDALLKSRADAEETLADLVTIYKEGGILATCDGTIYSLSSTSSDSYSSDMSGMTTSSSSGSQTVATISLNESMIISISVDETDILSLSEGQEAYVTIDSIGDDTFSGTVTSIGTTASSDSGVTSYTAEITIDKTSDMLSGMSASVVITIEGVDDALLIPVDALHQTSSTAYVYTEYDEETGEFSGMVEVTIGLSNSSYVEITDGLSEGDTVYYSETSTDDSSFSMDSIMGGMGGSDMGGMSGGSSDFSGGGSSSSMPSMGGGDSSGGGNMGGGSMPGGN